MKKHRGLFLGLGLAALLALSVREGRAETITMTIVTNGHTIVVTGSLVSSQTSTNFQVNTTNLNNLLTADGSAYQFSALGATSDWPGTTGSQGGSLSTSGGLYIPTTATGATGPLTITTTEDGFTAPTGPNGTLVSTETANFTNVPTGGTETYQSGFGPLPTTLTLYPTPPLSATSSGTTANNWSPSATNSVGNVPSPYALGNTLTINLTQNTAAQAQLGFSGAAQIFATTVPEPMGLVMMLTGMPLPLVVVGLLRRRLRAA